VPGVKAINPYLVDGPMVALPRRSKPLWDAPILGLGNQPIDGGHYLFSESEAADFITAEPGAAPFMREWIGAEEFLNGGRRRVLYLCDAKPADLRALVSVRKRVAAVATFRKASKREATRALAATPRVFAFHNQPNRE
jgi:hypothetical protein